MVPKQPSKDSGRKGKGRKGKSAKKESGKKTEPVKRAREQVGTVIDPDLAVVIKDPLRVEILILANQRTISPSEFAEETGCGVGSASYHFKVLKRHGFIELIKRVPVRGATKHMYKATRRAYLSNDDWRRVPASLRPDLASVVLREFNVLADEAMESGTFYARDDAYLLWKALALDEVAWGEFVDLMAMTYERVEELEEESAKRQADGESEGRVPVTFAIAGFESPGTTGRKSKGKRKAAPKKGHQRKR